MINESIKKQIKNIKNKITNKIKEEFGTGKNTLEKQIKEVDYEIPRLSSPAKKSDYGTKVGGAENNTPNTSDFLKMTERH